VFAVVIHNAAAIRGTVADFKANVAHLGLLIPVSLVLDFFVTEPDPL
jgi:hypothetical protein